MACVLFVLLGGTVLDWLPRGSGWWLRLHDFVRRVHGALHGGRSVRRLVLISLLIQVCRCLVFVFTFRAFGLEVSAASIFAFVPVLFVFVIAPISLGGLGVREGLLALMFVPPGRTAGAADPGPV